MRFSLLLLFLSTFLNIFVNSVLSTETLYLSKPVPPLTHDEISELSGKFQYLFSSGGGDNLSKTDKLKSILDELTDRLKLDYHVPESNELDDVQWGTVEKCYDLELRTDNDKSSVNLFNSTLRRVISKFFEFHIDHLDESSSLTTLNRINALYNNIQLLAKETINCVRDVKDWRRYEPTRLGLTPYAAYTDGEFEDMYLMGIQDWDRKEEQDGSGWVDEWPRFHLPCNVSEHLNLPNRYDWRTDYQISRNGGQYSPVTPVKDQGKCASSHIFAATAAMESAYMLSDENDKREQTVLSEQQLLDCANDGCKGGFHTNMWKIAGDNGLLSLNNYPYVGHPELCKGKFAKRDGSVGRPTRYCINRHLRSDEDIIRVLYQFGPSVVAIAGSDPAFKLLRGPWNRECQSRNVDHLVTAVGYTEDHFIFKNSWGSSWGEDGYLVMKRDNTDRCKIYTSVGLPFFFNQNGGYNH